ncbi:MAG: DUF4082 domain-containing protein [Bdellovibrio sp.]
MKSFIISVALLFSSLQGLAAETIFGNAVPANEAELNDTAPVELGLKFQALTDGTVSAVRFYRGVAIPSGYRASLWDSNGNLLATGIIIEGQSPVPGWQTVQFSNPVSITANTTYVASYFASNGQYAFEEGMDYDITNGNLVALGGIDNDGNGVYKYDSVSGFPTDTYNNTNYFVDVVFTAAPLTAKKHSR